MIDRENQQQTVTDGEIGWLAGIIDGEGSITLLINSRKGEGRPTLRVRARVIITNSDMAIIDKTIDILTRLHVGKWVHHTKTHTSDLVKKAYKDMHYVNIDGTKRLDTFLPVIIPHLAGEKKNKAIVLLKFIKRRLDISEKLDIARNIRYDEVDVENMLEFLSLTKTKNFDSIGRMLRDYTLGTSQGRCAYKDRVKAYKSYDIVRTT